MSPKTVQDICCDLPPAGERKGKTKADSDRHLGNPIVCHRFRLIRDPAGTMAPTRRKNVIGELGPHGNAAKRAGMAKQFCELEPSA
jgi:hypothetical protein